MTQCNTLRHIYNIHIHSKCDFIYVCWSLYCTSVWSPCTISAVALLYVVAVVTTAVCALSHLVLASPHAQCQVYMTNHISKTNREGISELFLCFSWRVLLRLTFSKMSPGQLIFQAFVQKCDNQSPAGSRTFNPGISGKGFCKIPGFFGTGLA